MDLDPLVAPSTSTNVLGRSRQRLKKANNAIDDEDPNTWYDFYMYSYLFWHHVFSDSKDHLET